MAAAGSAAGTTGTDVASDTGMAYHGTRQDCELLLDELDAQGITAGGAGDEGLSFVIVPLPKYDAAVAAAGSLVDAGEIAPDAVLTPEYVESNDEEESEAGHA